MVKELKEISGLKQYNRNCFTLIAGPCVVESRELTLHVARTISAICTDLNIPFVFKASYRKANRSKGGSFTGIGDMKGLEVLAEAGKEAGVPVITDIHSAAEASVAARYADILQIPAFLCRQTDILVAAGETGKWVNIKKGQFLSGPSMRFAAEKVLETGNDRIILTERGNMFGYGDLIVDFRNIVEMKELGYPVVMDVTHSLQQPNQASGVSGGLPKMIETIAKAAIVTGADGIFIETHPEPHKALSDGANMLPLDKLEPLLRKLLVIHESMEKFNN